MTHKILDNINSPQDVAKLDYNELDILASEIRDFLIRHLAKTGGHLASNLGVVEITLALYKVFSFPEDKIVFDVGHQSYVHKILTGRKDRFDMLRQKDGLSGFPKRSESVYDSFNTGHSSTSISAAEGMACARDMRGEKNHIIALIGDGAMTGGMAFEALNDSGTMHKNFIVILNDNQMSIAENVGAMSQYFRRISTNKEYFQLKRSLERTLLKFPYMGKNIIKFLRYIKTRIKGILFIPTIFDEMGFAYIGPFDGHNVKLLCKQLKRAKDVDCPVFIHIHTKKGKGYTFAEDKPSKFHGVSQFNIITGENLKKKKMSTYSDVFGCIMVELAKKHKFACITPAMTMGSGLLEFSKKYPDRFFDVAIAEQHAVTFAAGLAANGMPAVVAIYSTFLQRAYDQVLHDVCLPRLHVVFAIDRAGAVSGDGETHQGVFDMNMLVSMPNMTFLTPASREELKECFTYAMLECDGPVAVRYPKGKEEASLQVLPYHDKKAQVLRQGNDVCILSVGHMTKAALEAADILEKENVSCSVLHLRFIKPLDEETILECARSAKMCLTVEDGMICGGVGEMIVNLLGRNQVACPTVVVGYPDTFIAQATAEEIHEEYGLTGAGIAETIRRKMCDMNL